MSEDIHKWTNGRYTLMFDEHTFFVLDNEKEKEMTSLEVTKKLNEQQEEIEELIITIKLYEADIIEKDNKIKQLKQELDNFKPVMFQDMRKGTVILYSKEG